MGTEALKIGTALRPAPGDRAVSFRTARSRIKVVEQLRRSMQMIMELNIHVAARTIRPSSAIW